MRTGGVFHPNFFYSPRRTLVTTQLVDLEIFALTPEGGEWVPGVGLDITPDVKAWKGKGRVQPNKDWRARPREVQFEYDAMQAVRVQLPIGKNLIGAVTDLDTGKVISYGEDPEFIKDMRVRVLSAPVKGFEMMLDDDFYIRNAIQNQNLWVYNLLCDTKTGGQESP